VISGSWVRERRFTLPRLLPRRVRSLHTLALVLATVLIGWLGWTWYRGSSFVKVQRVTVTGLSGPDVGQIRQNLTSAALTMTTLDVDIAKLEATVSQYAYVQRLTVTGQGAHGLLIHVDERVPVAVIQNGGQTQIVGADGRLLPATTTHGALPTVPLPSSAAGEITAPGARAAIAVLAAAPYALLAHVSSATSSSAHGVIVQLRNGPQLYFGPSTQLAQKWAAAVAVLQNRDSAGAAYIDLTDPQRPAPGSGVSAQRATSLGLTAGPTTSTTAGTLTGG
jgi:cell division protein FtsQ